jgi:hypothetical protein
MLDDPHVRAIPRNPRGFGGQAADEPEQVKRYLLGMPNRRASIPADRRTWAVAAQRAVP